MTDDLRNMFTAWIKKVIIHAKIDYIRRNAAEEKKHSRLSLADVPEPSYEQDFRLTPENEFDFAEEKLAEAFAELPLLRRQILTLSFAERLTAMEIAEQLNCSVEYVHLQKHRTLKALRDKLLNGGETGEI